MLFRSETARAFLGIKKKRGPAALAVIAGGRCSNEESYLLQKLARKAMGTNHVDLGVKPAWAEAAAALEAVTGPGICGPSVADLQDAGAIFVLGGELAAGNPVAAMAVEQACRLGGTVLVQVGTAERELTAWERLVLAPRQGAEAELFEALAAVLRGQPAAEQIRKAGVDGATLKRAAQLLGGAKSIILVCPSFFKQKSSKWIGPLLEAARAGGQLERGKSNLLLLAEEGNARGIVETGGAPQYLPGYVSLDGKAGLDFARILTSAEAGEIKGIFASLDGLGGPLPAGLEFLAVQCSSKSAIPVEADVIFPALPVRLKEGSFTNSAGRQEHNLSAAGGGIQPEWQVIASLARAMGEPADYGSLQEVQEEICRVVAGR